MQYPSYRSRRIRQNQSIRELVAETVVGVNDLIAPLFVVEGTGKKIAIDSMPGYSRFSLDLLIEEIKQHIDLGIKAFLLFAKIEEQYKDNTGQSAINQDGFFQRCIHSIKSAFPDIVLMSDVALDPYSVYGHDGIVEDGQIINDATVDVLAHMALTHAMAGVDFVAPSDMMDGRIGAIRSKLEDNQYHQVGIMAYSAKYASCFYGPFRDALDSAPGFGDKKSYQMNFANRRSAILEMEQDVVEGADILMIKPAMAYLDIIREARTSFNLPIAAYHVSGEYAMIHASAQRGWIDLEQAMIESLTSIKRAGADLIATYFAKDMASLLTQ